MKTTISLTLLLSFTLISCSTTKTENESPQKGVKTQERSGRSVELPSTPIKAGIVNFAFDSAEIPRGELSKIEGVVEKLRQDPEMKTLVVKGHADLIGPDRYNYELSYRRAVEVKEALVAKGLRAEAIKVESFGEERPIIQTMDREKSEVNRRVVIQINTDQEKNTLSSN